MTSARFRNTEVRLSAALAGTRDAIAANNVTLRELLALVGEQGLLVFCSILALPFLLPVPIPFMSAVLGLPMLLIGTAVILNRVPWLPDRLLDHPLPAESVRGLLDRAQRAAGRFEHLVRPRALSLTDSPAANAVNGIVLVIAVLTLMVPLPFVPFANAVPAVGIVLLCLGMAERDGVVIVLGHVVTAFAVLFVGAITWLVVKVGSNPHDAMEAVRTVLERLRDA